MKFSSRKAKQKIQYDFRTYFLVGSSMLVLCILILLLFLEYFKEIKEIRSHYYNDECKIFQIEKKIVNINCWNDYTYPSIIQIPCVKITVKTKLFSNLTFFRNINEMLYAYSNNANVRLKIIIL